MLTFCFDFLFSMMATFEAYDNSNARQTSMLLKLFLWKGYTTTLLPILLNSELIQRNNLYMFYDDFTPEWYLNIGTGLIKSSYFRLLFVFLELLLDYFTPRFWQWRDRGYQNKFYETKVYSKVGEVKIPNTRTYKHEDYVGIYTNDSFYIDRSYPEVLNILTFCFVYGFILPHLFIPNTLVLIAILFKDKILCKFFDQKIELFDETFVGRLSKLLI